MVACWFRTTEKWRGGCRAYYVAEKRQHVDFHLIFLNTLRLLTLAARGSMSSAPRREMRDTFIEDLYNRFAFIVFIIGCE